VIFITSSLRKDLSIRCNKKCRKYCKTLNNDQLAIIDQILVSVTEFGPAICSCESVYVTWEDRFEDETEVSFVMFHRDKKNCTNVDVCFGSWGHYAVVNESGGFQALHYRQINVSADVAVET
jgi:hypothetical protein